MTFWTLIWQSFVKQKSNKIVYSCYQHLLRRQQSFFFSDHAVIICSKKKNPAATKKKKKERKKSHISSLRDDFLSMHVSGFTDVFFGQDRLRTVPNMIGIVADSSVLMRIRTTARCQCVFVAFLLSVKSVKVSF